MTVDATTVDIISVILLGFIFLWLFIGGWALGRVIFKTHEACNTNFQAQAQELSVLRKLLGEANETIRQLVSAKAADIEKAPLTGIIQQPTMDPLKVEIVAVPKEITEPKK